LAALTQIKAAAVSDTFPSAIEFAGAAIRLHARPVADSILPRPDVVRQLLASSDAPAAAAAASVVGVPAPQPEVSFSHATQQSSGGAVGRKSEEQKSNAGVVCKNWAATASCRFGSSCHYKDSHISCGNAAVEQPRPANAAAGGGKQVVAAPAGAAPSEANGNDSAADGRIGDDSNSRGGRGRGRGGGGGRGGGRGSPADAAAGGGKQVIATPADAAPSEANGNDSAADGRIGDDSNSRGGRGRGRGRGGRGGRGGGVDAP
jgi:hypothetical protein